MGEGCDENRDCEEPDLYSRGSSVKSGDAMNDDDEADDELADDGLHVRAGEGDIFVGSGENPY